MSTFDPTQTKPTLDTGAFLLALAGGPACVGTLYALLWGFDPALGPPLFYRSLPVLSSTWLLCLLPVACTLVGWISYRSLQVTRHLPWVSSFVVLTGLLWCLFAVGRLYAPHKPFLWAYYVFKADAAQTLVGGSLLALLLMSLLPPSLLLADTSSRKREARRTLRGSARWADVRDCKQAGLFEPSGPPLGYLLGQQNHAKVRATRGLHVGIAGRSGCGKSTALIIPALLTHPTSAIVLDIKGELGNLTSGCRAARMGHQILTHAPLTRGSTGYNPLLDLPQGDSEAMAARRLAKSLIPRGADANPFWNNSAENLLVAMFLHALYALPNKSLGAVAAQLGAASADSHGIRRTLQQMLMTQHDPTGGENWTHAATGEELLTHPVVFTEAANLINLAGPTLSSIVSTARAALASFSDLTLAQTTLRHDFTLTNFGQHRPQTLYLQIPASNLEELAPYIRGLLSNLSYAATQELAEPGRDGSPERQPITIYLDELTSLGKIRMLTDEIAFLRGYGLQLVTAFQTNSQLKATYGQYEAVRGNFSYLVAFPPGPEEETAQALSRLIGNTTVHADHGSRSKAGAFAKTTIGHSESSFSRPLITPDELRRRPDSQPILFAPGTPPIQLEAARHYQDPALLALSGLPPVQSPSNPPDISRWTERVAVVPPVGSLPDLPPERGAVANNRDLPPDAWDF